MPVKLRRGTAEDMRPVFAVSMQAYYDLLARFQLAEPGELSDGAIAEEWLDFQPLLEHLDRTHDQFWVAEDAGRAVGSARSVRRGRVRILTELFVLPGTQEDGVGRRLLERAIPDGEDRGGLAVLATSDLRALSRYLRLGPQSQGVACRFVCPRPRREAPPKSVERHEDGSAEDLLPELAKIDRAVLGYAREADHRWLLETREAWLLRRNGALAAYCCVAPGYTGPGAALESDDLPPLLVQAESRASEGGWEHGLRVCLSNRRTVDLLLARGYRMDGFWLHMLADFAMPGLDRYVLSTPPYFP